MKKIELLAPAGRMENLKIALLYGADAVYFGGRNYSLRANAKNLGLTEIKEACDYAHSLGKKVYVTVNIVFHNEDTNGIIEYLKKLSEIGVDAIDLSNRPVSGIIIGYSEELLWVKSTEKCRNQRFYLIPLDSISFILQK